MVIDHEQYHQDLGANQDVQYDNFKFSLIEIDNEKGNINISGNFQASEV